MEKNNILVMFTSMFVFLSSLILLPPACNAQIPCYNICQKTIVQKDCWGAVNQTVEFLNITCEQVCPSEEHVRTVCPCTWEMWRQITETDCEGKTTYSEQKINDYPCGTDPIPDENVTIPCVKPDGLSGFITLKTHYVIHQNNCVCDEFTDIYYTFIDMGCHSHTCRKVVTREFCDGSIVTDPPVNTEVPCPGVCPPDELFTDTVCQYECGLITTYYDCDDPETVDYVEPMQTVTFTYNCSNHDIPFCPSDEEVFEECDIYGCLNEKFQRKVVREYRLLRKDCTKATRISTVYEMVN
jgi:hypothetical protein